MYHDDEIMKHEAEVLDNIRKNSVNTKFSALTEKWMIEALRNKYDYNFHWMGRPAIQLPTDTWALQDIIWRTRPDLIIECGVAHGGSLIMSASLLTLLEYDDAVMRNEPIDITRPTRKVVGIDIDIRSHNRKAIESHSMSNRICLIEGSSTSKEVIDQVKKIAANYGNVMVTLDSNHTHEHVLNELMAYGPFVTKNCYCVVWDGGIESLPEDLVSDRPWGVGNNPKTATLEFLKHIQETEVLAVDGRPLNFDEDPYIESRIMITAASNGFLKRR